MAIQKKAQKKKKKKGGTASYFLLAVLHLYYSEIPGPGSWSTVLHILVYDKSPWVMDLLYFGSLSVPMTGVNILLYRLTMLS